MATATKKQSASTVRNVLQSITVGREGKPFTPPVGQPFEFTAEEIAQIERMNPAAISTAITLDASDPAVAEVVSGATGGESGL